MYHATQALSMVQISPPLTKRKSLTQLLPPQGEL